MNLFRTALRVLMCPASLDKHIGKSRKLYPISQHLFQRNCSVKTNMMNGENPIIMKLNSPEFNDIITEEVKKLYEIFTKYGHELRIAGGAVRDLLMNIKPHDVDFATTATPDEMKEMFEKEGIRLVNMGGEKHGTITPRINDKENFEVTTLRIDICTDGRHAQVEFTTDWKLDAGRRDLTINAMFLGLDGSVYDYFTGYQDLLNRKIQFVGNPVTRIQEDYLRILRYFRFYGRIAEVPDKHDEGTLVAIKDNAEGLSRISGERIWVELRKIVSGKWAGELLSRMLSLGIAPHIGLPENPNISELLLVWKRSKHLNLLPMTIIASVLRDEKEMLKLHERLKLSAFERDLGFFLVEHRGDKLSSNPIRPYQKLVIHSKLKQSDIKKYIIEIFKYRGDVILLAEFENWEVPRFPVTGQMLKSRGFSGKALGAALIKMKECWIDSNFSLNAEELLQQIKMDNCETKH